MVDCPHLQDAVKAGCLNSTYEPPWNCVECGNANHPWMCLYCGDIRCGRYANAHAIEHFKSYCAHNVLFDCHVYSVYCYACDDYVVNDHTSRTIGLLRAKLQQLNSNRNSDSSNVSDSSPSPSSVTEDSVTDDSERERPRSRTCARTSCSRTGLRNLGNTCFMNSVLQALNAVTFLRSYLLTLPGFDEPTRAFASLCRLPYRPSATPPTTPPDTNSLPDVVTDTLLTSGTETQLTPPPKDFDRSFTLPLPDPGDGTRITRNAARRMRAIDVVQRRSDNEDDPDDLGNVDNPLLCDELRRVMHALSPSNVQLKKTSCREPVSPDALFQLVWQAVPRFRGYQQQDAHEFMRYLLDQLDSELNVALYFHHRTRCCLRPLARPSDPLSAKLAVSDAVQRGAQKPCNRCGWFGTERSSVVTAAFGGLLHSEVGCLQCGSVSVTPESFLDLQLDIPARFCKVSSRSRSRNTQSDVAKDDDSGDLCTLHDCLQSYTAVERLADSELYCCPACEQRQPSTKRFWIKRLPPVLCLHLKRFSWQHMPHARVKLDTFVEFPLRNLDLRSYVLQPDWSNASGSLYDLAAVIVHHGNGVGCGHYTAFVRDGSCWFHFNDSQVTPVSEDTVRKAHAYILLYSQRDANVFTGNKSPLGTLRSSQSELDLESARKKIKLEHSYSKSPSPSPSDDVTLSNSISNQQPVLSQCKSSDSVSKQIAHSTNSTNNRRERRKLRNAHATVSSSSCLSKSKLSSSNLCASSRASSD